MNKKFIPFTTTTLYLNEKKKMTMADTWERWSSQYYRLKNIAKCGLHILKSSSFSRENFQFIMSVKYTHSQSFRGSMAERPSLRMWSSPKKDFLSCFCNKVYGIHLSGPGMRRESRLPILSCRSLKIYKNYHHSTQW